jgi:multiple antibiotic resistance protein
MNDLSLLTLTVTLFLIMDSIGNISSYLTLMKDIPPKRQKYILFREMLIALAAMLAFNFLGEFLFDFLKVSEPAVRMASGVILFLIAIKILFPASNSLRENLPSGEPFIIPLANPLNAGPSLLATLMLYSHIETCEPMMLTAICIAWALSMVVLILAPYFQRFLGKNGLSACERLMAMVLVMISIQRFMEGVQMLVMERGA